MGDVGRAGDPEGIEQANSTMGWPCTCQAQVRAKVWDLVLPPPSGRMEVHTGEFGGKIKDQDGRM